MQASGHHTLAVRPGHGLRSAAGRALALVAVVLGTAGALGGCAMPFTKGDAAEPPRFVEAGPTLMRAVPPKNWQEIRHPSGLSYSVPPEWQVLRDPRGGAPARGGSGSGAAQPEVPGSGTETTVDWGFGIITSANAQAQPGYCMGGSNTESFRVRVGITEPAPGTAENSVAEMNATMSDAINKVFTRSGAEVEPGQVEKIGVSGTLAYHQQIIARPHQPRGACTPPRMRADIISVQLGTPEEPQSASLLLLGDLDEPHVEPEKVLDSVIGSLRFNTDV